MIKLITPPGILVTVALLVIYSVYAFSIGAIEGSFVLAAGGVMSLIASIGAALLMPWSRHLVYLLAAGFIGKLTLSIIDATRVGFFDFQFDSGMAAVCSLGPSLAMVLLSCLCCLIVHRQFCQRNSLSNGNLKS